MTPTQSDSLGLALLVAGVLVAVVVAVLVERLRAGAPVLPEADRPPRGLGRLVPVGGQVDADALRGLVALEAWLAGGRPGTP